jgi:hypothetical protein
VKFTVSSAPDGELKVSFRRTAQRGLGEARVDKRVQQQRLGVTPVSIQAMPALG